MKTSNLGNIIFTNYTAILYYNTEMSKQTFHIKRPCEIIYKRSLGVGVVFHHHTRPMSMHSYDSHTYQR